MTEQEAIKILHPGTTISALAEIGYYAGFSAREAQIKAVGKARIIACSALEKQIPKEPKSEDGFFSIHHCPECGMVIGFGQKYCGECGQRLRWEK